jgi:membrane protein
VNVLGRIFKFIKGVASDFSDDDVLSLAAAVAFYTALSFAPLVLLLVTFGSLLGEGTKSQLLGMFSEQLGPRAADVTQSVVEASNASATENTKWWRVALSTIGLIVTASAVFGQLQVSLNHIWDVEAKLKPDKPPEQGVRVYLMPVWGWLRRRLISMGMVLIVLFILLVSLVVSATLGAIVPGEGAEFMARATEFLVSLIVAALLFAAIFKVLPDTPISWKHVWLGALVTSVLFNVGKLGLALYIDKGGVGKDYGEGIGGLIALLVWVYYSCVALLLGAEITQAIGRGPADERTASERTRG